MTTPTTTATRFARLCDKCGQPTNSGYHDDGLVYCSETCLRKVYTGAEWAARHEEFPDECYWTEWNPDDEPTFYDAKGREFNGTTPEEVPCPYCFHPHGVKDAHATYWTHELKQTIDASCHACDDTLMVTREFFHHALRQAGSDRAAAFLRVYPEASTDW